MSEPTKTVRLKNGSDEAEPLVAVITHVLEKLMDTGRGTAVYDLVQMCRDQTHKPFGINGETLKESGLVTAPQAPGDDWQVHGSVRNIVLSAIEPRGDSIDFVLVNPVATIAAETEAPSTAIAEAEVKP